MSELASESLSANPSLRPTKEAETTVDDVALTRTEVEDFLYREARLADENDYDGWEALWTDDAVYWVPADSAEIDPFAEERF